MAKAIGMWNFLKAVAVLTLPDDLAAALGGVESAGRKGYPNSVNRGMLESVNLAKSPQTRARGMSMWRKTRHWAKVWG